MQNKSEAEIAKEVLKFNPDDEGAYTTVGFEHEFARFLEDQDNPLAGQEHVELAKTERILRYTGLPFLLETDSLDTIELVGAPLIIPTSKEHPVPFADDINMADFYIQSALIGICEAETFQEMKSAFMKYMGLCFENVTDKNMDHLKIKYGSKGGGVAPQVNFATSAFVYDAAKDVSFDYSAGSATGVYLKEEKRYIDKMKILAGNDMTPNLTIFLKQLAKNLSFANFTNYLTIYKRMENFEIGHNPVNGLSFIDLGRLISLVKDTNTFWLKDTIFNFGLGILTSQEWEKTLDICNQMKGDVQNFRDCQEQIEILIHKITTLKANNYEASFEKPKVEYGKHEPEFLGARQDTYVSLDGNRKAPKFKDTTLHLVEMRGLGAKQTGGDMFHKVEKRLLEKSPLHFHYTPLGYSIQIRYLSQGNHIVIDTIPSNPFLSKKSSIFSVPELIRAKIEYDNLEEDDGTMITIPTGTVSPYVITLYRDQTSQFQYFMKRLLAVNSYQPIPQLPSQRTYGFDMEIKYIREDNIVEIFSKPLNPFMKEKRKTFSLLELRKSKIECDDLGDDDKMLTITGPGSSYSITLNSDQASQVQYFMKRLLQ